MRSKRVREAVSKKRTWKSRLAAVQVEEAALQPELDKLEGDTAKDVGQEHFTKDRTLSKERTSSRGDALKSATDTSNVASKASE